MSIIDPTGSLTSDQHLVPNFQSNLMITDGRSAYRPSGMALGQALALRKNSNSKSVRSSAEECVTAVRQACRDVPLVDRQADGPGPC